jgi:hypothetical protein
MNDQAERRAHDDVIENGEGVQLWRVCRVCAPPRF